MKSLIKLAKEYFDFKSIYSSRGYDEIIDNLESEVKELTQKLKVERDVVSDLKKELVISTESHEALSDVNMQLSDKITELSGLITTMRKNALSQRTEIAELKKIIDDKDSVISDQSARLDKNAFIVNCAESKAIVWEEELIRSDMDRKVLKCLVALISFGWAITSIAFYLSLNQ